MITVSEIESIQRTGERLQERINELHNRITQRWTLVEEELEIQNNFLRLHLISIAEARLANFPQYGNGFFDHWTIGKINGELITEMGIACKVGDVILCKYETPSGINPFSSGWKFFSLRNFCTTSLPKYQFEISDILITRLANHHD